MAFAFILPLLASLAALSAADTAALDQRAAEIFRPYKDGSSDKASGDYPVFSADTAALIAHWQRVLPPDEPDRLNDGDWFCQCQDWNADGFKATMGEATALPDGTAEVVVKVDLGFDEVPDLREARLVFRREEAGWKLDDMFAADAFPEGLKQALRETIAEDEALAKSRVR